MAFRGVVAPGEARGAACCARGCRPRAGPWVGGGAMRLASETAHGAFALSSYPPPLTPPRLACGQPASEAACRLHCRCAMCVIEQHTRVRAAAWARNTCALGPAVCVGETGPRGAFVLPHLGAVCPPGPSSAPWLQESGHQRPCSHSPTLCLCRRPPSTSLLRSLGGRMQGAPGLPPAPPQCAAGCWAGRGDGASARPPSPAFPGKGGERPALRGRGGGAAQLCRHLQPSLLGASCAAQWGRGLP